AERPLRLVRAAEQDQRHDERQDSRAETDPRVVVDAGNSSGRGELWRHAPIILRRPARGERVRRERRDRRRAWGQGAAPGSWSPPFTGSPATTSRAACAPTPR